MIQILYKCEHYRDNTNLNKTCTKNNRRCELYYTNHCLCFSEKDNKNATQK